MTKRTRTLVIALLLLAAIAGISRWVLQPRKETPPPSPRAEAPLDFLAQEIISVEPVELRQVLQLSGSLRAVDLATIKARIAGEVRDVQVREGEPVRAGQIVVRMDTAEYDARVAQARGNLNNARAQLAIAAKTRENNLALVEQGFISRNAFDNSASQFEAAQAAVDAAQGALDLVMKSLNDTVLRTPISGLVSVRHVQPGEKVAADAKLLDIVNLQKLELEAAVPASDIAQVAIGQPVELHIEGQPGTVMGKVARINPAAQTDSRSVPVYVQLANPEQRLRVGMFAEAQLVLASRTGVLALPSQALRHEGGTTYVFAIENGKIVRRTVTPGTSGLSSGERRVEIVAGLAPGAQVIRADMGNLQPGTPARISPAAVSSK